MPELSVVVPAYRERENIPLLLDALEQALAGLDWEAIVVADAADDGTEEVVRERAQRDSRVRIIQRIGRRGLASACVEGMLSSSAPYLAVMDADLQHDEKLLPKLLDAAKHGGADGGGRRVSGAALPRVGGAVKGAPAGGNGEGHRIPAPGEQSHRPPRRRADGHDGVRAGARI